MQAAEYQALIRTWRHRLSHVWHKLKPETKLNIECVDVLRSRASVYVKVFHAPSEGRRGKLLGAILNAMGWEAGFPDLVIFAPIHPQVFFVEFKVKGTLTDAQKGWATHLRGLGYIVTECNTVEEFTTWAEGWGLIR